MIFLKFLSLKQFLNCVRICLNPIHSKCIHTGKFYCPFDRCPRNSSIPIIAGIFDEKAYYNDVKFALFSLASQIEILEMRHRSNPGCLDDVITQMTLRNIYLCIWHVMRKEVSEIIDSESTLNSKPKIGESNSERQSQVDNFARMLSFILRGNHLKDDADDDVNTELARTFVNDKMGRNTNQFTSHDVLRCICSY